MDAAIGATVTTIMKDTFGPFIAQLRQLAHWLHDQDLPLHVIGGQYAPRGQHCMPVAWTPGWGPVFEPANDAP